MRWSEEMTSKRFAASTSARDKRMRKRLVKIETRNIGQQETGGQNIKRTGRGQGGGKGQRTTNDRHQWVLISACV